MKKKIKFSAIFLMMFAVLFSCTDLEIEETDSILTSGFDGLSAEEASSSLNDMYNSLVGAISTQENLYSLTEVTSDALLIPTRGSDWGDNGLWRQLHQHSWTPDHRFVTNTWNQWNQLQLSASEVIDERSSSSPQVKAQAHFLRALSMYIILDNYGQVPYRDTEALPSVDPVVLTEMDAVNFIVEDLNVAISNLEDSPAGNDNSTASKTAARFLLAKVLLNKHIFTNTSVDNADMGKVIDLVDQISASGYELQDGYFDIFNSSADSETIWYIPASVGPKIFSTLHYNSTELGGGGWNGFSTLAEYYDLYEGDPTQNRLDADGNPIDGQEERRGGVPPMGIPVGEASDPLLNGDDNGDGYVDGSNVGNGFLIGQQYATDGTPLEDRGGAPLAFTRDFTNSATNAPSLTDNSEVSGIRLIKYNPRYGAFKEHHIFFRYSDAYLMKAEAMLRSGQDITGMINNLRTLRDASPLANVTEKELLEERGRELYTEFWRRNDLIRFGEYTRDWEFKDPGAIGNPDRELFPIPATQVILNPNLVQNPGY
ncbi:RagB/SusD family nutrient uptake outer membrane protein [Psychroflexus sp. CAK57W]|uniref:RagB/SusD family nutrient uptake outer membrane protein n=1 Tax=Psychroflexus curvus TaxID=2873595 RepID=UPI001CCCCE8C|nr:RagB/SusD family nutrient uptake outer membrane protein [Psychroflexus curvus]MBZ9626578.1 RagB/SusD family nutrient uptake outer membrane protein [Psychroflexus curvus]MBZ9786345.1 RagB/SusD family nutrient uptake outer membrane protein [Psychroflexus curvus]